MKIEAQVTSLELSKKLKELGVKQESQFYWHHNKIMAGLPFFNFRPTHMSYSAFTVAELGEVLPASIKYPLAGGRLPKYSHYLHISPDYYAGGKWSLTYNSYHSNRNIEVVDDSEAGARAKMLIYLIENNLLERHANQQPQQG